MKGLIRRVFSLLSLPPGYVQAWLADGYREAGVLERSLILPSWLVFRGLFLIFYYLAQSLE